MNVRWKRAVVIAGWLYLFAFASDAALSIAHSATGVSLLAVPRWLLAVIVAAASLPTYFAAGCLNGLPRRVFWALPLYAWFGVVLVNLFASIFTSQATADLVAVGLQGIVASGALVAVRVARPDASTVAFSLRRVAGFTAFNLLALPAGLVAALLALTLTGLHVWTGAYLQVRIDGIYSVERVFRAEGREVRLIGMSHIGDAAFYRALAVSFDEPGTIVLEEGVEDRRHLTRTGSAGANVPSPMEDLAAAVGLDNQGELHLSQDEMVQAVRRNADLDFEDFDPVTIAWVDAMARAVAGEDLSRAELETFDLDPDVLWNDLLDRRNENLLRHLDTALEDFPVVILPWGAAHMPALDAALRARGFVPVGSPVMRRVFGWSSLG